MKKPTAKLIEKNMKKPTAKLTEPIVYLYQLLSRKFFFSHVRVLFVDQVSYFKHGNLSSTVVTLSVGGTDRHVRSLNFL